MNKEVFVTSEGLKKLEDELNLLKAEKRKEVSDKLRVALSFGDLSENSEYDEAKNEQAIVEARIAELEVMLKNIQILDSENLSTDVVSVGSIVTVYDGTFDEEVDYQIVGSTEANPSEDKISDESPIGKALLGLKVGDEATVSLPNGEESKLKVLKIGR